jgi:aspartate kinase
MAVYVQKFGGTSLATIERIQRAAQIIIKARKSGHQVVVVVSAMGSETDSLVDLARHVGGDLAPREYDMLLSSGEQKSMALLAMALLQQNCPARSLTGWQANIHTDAHHGKSKIIDIDTKAISSCLLREEVVVVAGFQGVSQQQEITTLGRGGSDLTAVALAAALHAEECQIYSDVDGVHTVDPRLIISAPKLSEVSFGEMLVLSALGAKVLHRRAVKLAQKLHVPLRVLSSMSAGEGTLLFDNAAVHARPVTGLACLQEVTLFRLSCLGGSEVEAKIHAALDRFKLVDALFQFSSNGSHNQATFVVNNYFVDALEMVLRVELGAEVLGYELASDLCVISLVGQAVGGGHFAASLLNELNIGSECHFKGGCYFSFALKSNNFLEALGKLHQQLGLSILKSET